MKSKLPPNERIKLIDDLASKAMTGILAGIYSDPGMFETCSKLAAEQNITLPLYISETAYTIANAMRITKHKMNNDDQGKD